MDRFASSRARTRSRRRTRELAGGTVRARIGLFALWAGGLLTAFAGFQVVDGWISQRNALARLERSGRQTTGAASAPLPALPVLADSSFSSLVTGAPPLDYPTPLPASPEAPPPEIGEIVGRLRIPSAGIDLAVFEGVSSDVLRRGPGHVPGTGLPTRGSNCVIAAHRDSFFRRLKKVEVGDRVFLSGDDGSEREYRLASRRVVSPEEVGVMAPTATEQVTLVTCFPFEWIGPAPYRIVWQALPVASVAKLAEGPPTTNSR